jgi:signal transduction histidine kinase
VAEQLALQQVFGQGRTVDGEKQSAAPGMVMDGARLHGSGDGVPLQTGPARALGEDYHPMLLWLQAVATPESDHWLLGIAKDQKTLTEFLGDLHWHLDGVLLLTYLLITLLGYYAMRSIGRIYERRLEAQVRERTRQLEEAHESILSKTRLATIGQTASVLTHEMRNPLASIKLALSGLKGSKSLQERERHRVELVLGEVDRLDALLSDTLDYVRPVKLSAEPVVMDRLLSRVLKQQEPVMAEKGIRIRREICTECPATGLDEAKMHQVLLNLLKNAVEAGPEGSEIGVRLQRDEGGLALEIANAGEPLNPETLERAFEPFYTTKPKGSGLGLGLVKRVVEEHGGTVVLTSDAQTGTRVTLHLPFAPA